MPAVEMHEPFVQCIAQDYKKPFNTNLNALRYCICTLLCLTVYMTLAEFRLLKREEQVAVIKGKGTFLFIRQEAGIDIVLYQVASFYAEVYFEGDNKKSIRIKSFDDIASLDVYLAQINITELQQLL